MGKAHRATAAGKCNMEDINLYAFPHVYIMLCMCSSVSLSLTDFMLQPQLYRQPCS